MDQHRARSFGAAAASYAAGRPSYPVEAVRWVLPEDARRVLDLGAGTGKLTSVLLELGLEVVAVEPDDAMRALIDTRAVVHAGTAEQLPPVGSVDAVVVGQAWHWFDHAAALTAIRGVLRPGGTLGLLWNLFDDRTGWWRSLPQVLPIEDVVSRLDPSQTPSLGEGDVGRVSWSHAQFPHQEPADKQRLLTNLSSRSIVLVMPEPERQALWTRLAALVPEDVSEIPYVCDAWRATLDR